MNSRAGTPSGAEPQRLAKTERAGPARTVAGHRIHCRTRVTEAALLGKLTAHFVGKKLRVFLEVA